MSLLRRLALIQLALGLAALAWAHLAREPIPYRFTLAAFAVAALVTVIFTAINFTLFFAGAHWRRARPVYDFLERDIFPWVRKASVGELLLVAAVAGFSEELVFRGLLLPRMGNILSSVLFGVLHGPDRRLAPLAVWAGSASLLFGVLYTMSGNLALPTLVHGFYDAVALLYIRSTSAKRGDLDVHPVENRAPESEAPVE